MIWMNSTKKTRVFSVIMIILTLSIIAFIFTQSLLPGKVSGEESGRVLRFLNGILESFGLAPFLTHSFVRTAAHFTEFGCLGLSFFLTFMTFGKRCVLSAIGAVVSSVAVATVDECIQLFTDGRAFQFSDILTDSCGAILAVFLIFSVFAVILNIKKKRSDSNE